MTTKMSSKGQVVIPEDVRKRLQLAAGRQFIVLGEDDVVILKRVRPPSMGEFDRLVKEGPHPGPCGRPEALRRRCRDQTRSQATMRIVLDTHVLMSAIFFGGVPFRILDAWRHGKLQFAVFPEILAEYRQVAIRLNARYECH